MLGIVFKALIPFTICLFCRPTKVVVLCIAEQARIKYFFWGGGCNELLDFLWVFFHVTNILKHKNNHVFKLFNCFSFFLLFHYIFFFYLGRGGVQTPYPPFWIHHCRVGKYRIVIHYLGCIGKNLHRIWKNA